MRKGEGVLYVGVGGLLYGCVGVLYVGGGVLYVRVCCTGAGRHLGIRALSRVYVQLSNLTRERSETTSGRKYVHVGRGEGWGGNQRNLKRQYSAIWRTDND